MVKEYIYSLLRWIDSEAGVENLKSGSHEKTVDWLRIVPFVVLHLGCLGVFWVGWSPVAVWAALILYLIRMFAITGFYHRYFSHKAFRTHRFWQFIFGALGNASVSGPSTGSLNLNCPSGASPVPEAGGCGTVSLQCDRSLL